MALAYGFKSVQLARYQISSYPKQDFTICNRYFRLRFNCDQFRISDYRENRSLKNLLTAVMATIS